MITVTHPFVSGILLYLDPGSGSFLIQLLLDAILGMGVALRLYWTKIKALLFRKEMQALPVTEDKESED